jgi:hypothetical protein
MSATGSTADVNFDVDDDEAVAVVDDFEASGDETLCGATADAEPFATLMAPAVVEGAARETGLRCSSEQMRKN